jgi:hypothetical protein
MRKAFKAYIVNYKIIFYVEKDVNGLITIHTKT